MIKLRRMRCAGHVARMGEKRNAYRILVGEPEGKRPLGRPRRRWVDNIKMNLRDIRLCGLVIRVPGYRSKGPGFNSRYYQIF
jgi:hypothetical protein